jgi:hypothetical protein
MAALLLLGAVAELLPELLCCALPTAARVPVLLLLLQGPLLLQCCCQCFCWVPLSCVGDSALEPRRSAAPGRRRRDALEAGSESGSGAARRGVTARLTAATAQQSVWTLE